MVKVKASKRPNFRHFLIHSSREKVEKVLKGIDFKVKPKFKEIFVKSLKERIGNNIVLTVAREDVNKIWELFRGRINVVCVSGTLKGLKN